MRDIDIIFFYEHAARELDVVCAISGILEQRYGLRVGVEHWPSGLSRALRRFRRPRVVVMPGVITMETWDAILYDWRKSIFLGLTWEQLLSAGTAQRKTPRDEFALRHVIHHAWSEAWADFLRKIGVPEENIFINGNPAYMLYQEPYRRFFKTRSELASLWGLDVRKRWLFFPENFGWAFVPDHQVETDWLSRGLSRESANTMRDLARQTLQQTMQWCASIAGNSDVEIVIRPRPAVPLDDFRDAVGKTVRTIPPRMHFIKADSIREWIMASDVVVSFYSTSLIEAALAGKTCCMLTPYPIPTFLEVDWHRYIDNVSTEEELRSTCLGLSPLGGGSLLASWARNSMLDRGDPIKNLADYLNGICRGEIRGPSPLGRGAFVNDAQDLSSLSLFHRLVRGAFYRLPKWLLFEYKRIRNRESRRAAPGLILKIHENDHMSEEELQQRADKWKGCLSHYAAGSEQAVRVQTGGSLGENAAAPGKGS